MKWLLYLLLAAGVVGSWAFYVRQGSSLKTMQQNIRTQLDAGDPQGEVPALQTEMQGKEGERTFSGILLTFLSAGFVGILFVLHVLPFFAQRLTHAVYDSAELMERNVMSGARSLLAQGDYEGAIEAFKEAAAAEPMNRMPWMEIAKIYKDNLHDPASAIATIRGALESQEWEVNDAAYFLFRLAELYDEVGGDRESAISIMNQVVEQFPETRHSANALHKLHEWSLQTTEVAEGEAASEQAATLEDEEAAYLARLRAAEAGEETGEETGEYAEGEQEHYIEELPPEEESGPDRRV